MDKAMTPAQPPAAKGTTARELSDAIVNRIRRRWLPDGLLCDDDMPVLRRHIQTVIEQSAYTITPTDAASAAARNIIKQAIEGASWNVGASASEAQTEAVLTSLIDAGLLTPTDAASAAAPCPTCHGTGSTRMRMYEAEALISCAACHGTGRAASAAAGSVTIHGSEQELIHLRNILHYYIRYTDPPEDMRVFAETLFADLRNRVGPMPYETAAADGRSRERTGGGGMKKP